MCPVGKVKVPCEVDVDVKKTVVNASSTTRMWMVAFAKKLDPVTTKLPSPLGLTEIVGATGGGGGGGG